MTSYESGIDISNLLGKKIGIMSTLNTGKTAVIHYLYWYCAQLGLNLGIVHEVIPLAISRGFIINEDTTLESQQGISNIQDEVEDIFTKDMRAGKYDLLVTDRTKIDHLAFPRRKFGKVATAGMFNDAVKYMELHPYTPLIRIPFWNVDLPITPNKIRSVNKNFQIEVNHVLDEILDEAGIPYVTLNKDLWLLPREEQPAAFMREFDRIFGVKENYQHII